MELRDWEQRHNAGNQQEPIPFVLQAASRLHPGKALDLACGTGRHSIWLAQQGWSVTAVDGSPTAIRILRERSEALHLPMGTQIANLERHEYSIEPEAWDLILMTLYLQRDLFEAVKLGVKPGGVVIAIALLAEEGEPSRYRVQRDELRNYFIGWEILDYSESHALARIAAARGVGRPACEPTHRSA